MVGVATPTSGSLGSSFAADPRCTGRYAPKAAATTEGAVISDTTVFAGGTVWTGTGSPATTPAVAVRDGTVVALGAEADALRDGTAGVVDLEGGFVMPSFGDGHAHPLFGGLEQHGPRIKEQGSVTEIVAEVRRWAAEHPEVPWIVAGSYDPSFAPAGEFDARWLDEAVADRPVVLRAFDYHTVWCNSEALRQGGIEATTPDPPLGTIVRRDDGSPLGTLREWHACDLVLRRAPDVTPDDYTRALADASRLYAASGVTWVQDAWVDDTVARAYLAAASADLLTLRFNLGQRVDPDHWRDQRPAFADVRREVERLGHPHLTATTVKFFADGVIEGGTAALLAPYDDAPDSLGMPVWSTEALAEAVSAFDADGFQVHIHAIGDAGVRAALDAIEAAVRANPAWDRRPVVAHTQLVDPADLSRFAALDVVANFEPLWAQLDPLMVDLTAPRLGAERTALQYPMAHLLGSGATVSFGSDWPVSSLRPLDGLQIATTRRTFEGDPPDGWTPHERLTLDDALRAYTAGVARQAFAEDAWGTIAPGRSADLVWLAADPFGVDPLALRHVEVRGTWLRGTRIHG